MNRLQIPRRFERRTVSMPVQCRTLGGIRHEGEISNISIEGCCIRSYCLHFRVGARVMVRPKGMEILTGTVRWISGEVAGIEFDRPIYDPIIDHLALTHPSEI